MSDGCLIRGCMLHDGSGAPPVAGDVRIRNGLIAEIGPGLPAQGERIVSAEGLHLSPGWIDLHAHVYSGMGAFSVEPEEAGLRAGVTVILDTGTAGALTYETLHRFVMPAAKEEIFALLHISRIGILQNHFDPPHTADLTDIRYVHVPSAVACIEKHRDRILGVKVRLTDGIGGHKAENERAGLLGALEAAEATGLPFMVHHVGSQLSAAEVLGRMRRGDIYTHMYHIAPDNVFAQGGGKPPPEVLEARARGVIFDVGHGSGSFAWDVAAPACQEYGFWPDCISTDLHKLNLHGPVFDLATTMSKFLHLGMPLAKVVRAVTAAPAHAMGLPGRFGRLLPGRQADLTLFKLEEGNWDLCDCKGRVQTARQRVRAVGVFKRGEDFSALCAKTPVIQEAVTA